MFPLFSERFLNNPSGTSSPAALSNDARANSAPAAARIGSLRTLDLRALPREDGPPTELRTRKEKLAHFEKECTHVGDNIYVGAEAVAKSRQILQAAGITHVVNCVGFLYPPYFEDEVKYQTLYLQGNILVCVMVYYCWSAVINAPSGKLFFSFINLNVYNLQTRHMKTFWLFYMTSSTSSTQPKKRQMMAMY